MGSEVAELALKEKVREQVTAAKKAGQLVTVRTLSVRLLPSGECVDCFTSKVERALRVLVVEGFAAAAGVRRD